MRLKEQQLEHFLCYVLTSFEGLLACGAPAKLQTLTVVTTSATLGTNLILKPLGNSKGNSRPLQLGAAPGIYFAHDKS